MKPELPRKGSRILALDLRAYRIGYAAFEAPNRPLEFGVTSFKASNIGLARARLLHIIHRVKPDKLILRKTQPSSSRNTIGARKLLHFAYTEARREKFATVMVRESNTRLYFRSRGATTKYQIASLLVERFPELEWKLPRPRKAWRREHPNMAGFSMPLRSDSPTLQRGT